MQLKLIFGKTGVGKTHYVIEWSNINNKNLRIVNPYDFNKKSNPFTILLNRDISGKEIIYLFDDIDCMSKKIQNDLIKLVELDKGKDIVIFLTATNPKKIKKELQRLCSIMTINPKSKDEIKEILRKKFSNNMGKSSEVFEEIIEFSSSKCHSDLRKAFQLTMYQKSTAYDANKLEHDNLEAIKLILYEEDRYLVYNYIRQLSISGLYVWLYETFSNSQNEKMIYMLKEMDKVLYNTKKDYIYSFLAFSLTVQKEKMIIKLPNKNKLNEIESSIINKIKNEYKCSKKECLMYLNLIKTLKENKKFMEPLSKRLSLNKKERNFLGLEEKIIIKERRKIVKTNTLLNY